MTFNAVKARDKIIEDIKWWFTHNGPNSYAVIGISGGKDSTVAPALLVRALGADRVIGVKMPNGYQADIDDSQRVIDALNIKSITIDVKAAFDGMLNAVSGALPSIEGASINDDVTINIPPRLRMTALYAVAAGLPGGGRVINTCNFSEDLVGYSTKFGDATGDVSILSNLFVSEIIAIGDTMPELPSDLVHKAPSDGLCGKTDEDRFGFTYNDIERYVTDGTSGDSDIDKKINKMYIASRHKVNRMFVCGVEKPY